MDASWIDHASAALQAIGTLAAIGFTVWIARSQARQLTQQRSQDRSDTEAARLARARVLAFRLAAVLNDMRISLGRIEKLGTNSAQIEQVLGGPIRILNQGLGEYVNRTVATSQLFFAKKSVRHRWRVD
jgi:hypothetical protein